MDDVIREGHPTLRKTANAVEFPLEDNLKTLSEDLLQFLINSQDPELAEKYDLRPGVGIAAPQVNVSKRFFAVHIPTDVENDEYYSKVLFNPKIISHSVQETCLAGGEGCLSVDREIEGIVPRHKRVKIEYYNSEGKKIVEKLRGYPAIVIQHELDHLNGVMFFDRIDKENPLALPDGIDILGGEE